MKKNERPEPPLSDERVDALWRSSAPRILVKERRARVQRRVAAGAVVLLACAAAGWRFVRPATAPSLVAEGQRAEGPRTVRLADDSVVELSQGALLEVDVAAPGEVRVALERGRARFEVSKHRGRVFLVRAGASEVRVVGTTFVVERSADGVVVSVEEGVVEVRRGEELKRLTRGARWQGTEPSVEVASAPPPSPALSPGPSMLPTPAPVDEAPRPSAPHHRVKRSTSAAAARGSGPAVDLPPAPEGPSAEELFRAAVDARRASGPKAAARAWATFLDSFPDDPRAGLAAFELGRIEMDVRHDTGRALRALEQALVLSPSAAFAEDAMARVVRLEDERRDIGACKAAKARYLSRYPQGTYASSLSPLCGE